MACTNDYTNFHLSCVFQLKIAFQINPTKLLNKTWYFPGIIAKLKIVLGIQSVQLINKVDGSFSIKILGTCVAGCPSSIIRLIMNNGTKRGAKKNWSIKVLWSTTLAEWPGIRFISVPYQKWTIGPTRTHPRRPNRLVRIQSGLKLNSSLEELDSDISSRFRLYWRYWQSKSPLAASNPLVKDFVWMGCVSNFIEYHENGDWKKDGPFGVDAEW